MKQEQLQLTGGGEKKNRRELDFYPTPSDVTIVLMDFLNNNGILPNNSNKTVWEPACGNGAMADIISASRHRVICSDIAKECDINGVQFPKGNSNTDFLSDLVNYSEIDAIITNPPFSLSVQFIEKAISISPVVCMLLKSQYWHAKNRYDLFQKHKPSYVLPLTWRPDFLEHERKVGEKKGAPTMEVAWSVWIRGINETKYIPLLKPKTCDFNR